MDKKITYNEQELVSLLKAKDTPSFNYLYTRYAGFLYHSVLQVVRDRHIAEEVLQEVFVKIWRNIGSYDESKSKLFTWILHVARNSAIDRVRSKATYQNSRKNCDLDDNIPIEINSRSFPANVDYIGVKEMLWKLRPKYRILIELAYLQGYTHEGIAERESLPLGTVKTRIRTGLLQLRAYLI
jgi:RNA polymerase sigma-70 factor (ECF subfamily)